MKFLPNILTVGCWNIEGVYEKVNGIKVNKLSNDTFENVLRTFDILCLQETHVAQQETLTTPENYVAVPHYRKISMNNRYFGGKLLLIKKSIRKGVKIKQDFDVDALEVILEKKFFGLQQNIKILFAYASPISSCYTKARSENILEKIENKIVDGRNTYLIMGELNGRTQKGDDFVRDNFDKYSPINDVPAYTKDEATERKNQDTHKIDEQGKLILDLCKSHSLRILNGRTSGDTQGRFTRYPKRIDNNPSVIDYSLCGEAILPEIFSFAVLPFTELSDHCCTSTNIRINAPHPDTTCEPHFKVNPNKMKLTYDEDKKHVFQANILLSEKYNPLLTTLNNPQKSIDDLNLCVTQLNSVILDAAGKSFLF